MSDAAERPLVLLVEDSAPVRDAFSILLGESGYRTAEAATGAEALDRIGEALPDLVLLDLGLPDMDGLDLVRRLRREAATSALPIVALTGRDVHDSAHAAGCAGFLAKPVRAAELLDTLREVLGR